MASTFVSYRGRDVQVPESALICIGYMLFHEAREYGNNPHEKARFERMARDFAARTIGVGCTDLGLDQMLEGKPEKEAEFLSVVTLVRERLRSFGERIPVEYIDQVIAVHEPDYKGQSLGSPWFRKVLDIIEALIRGQPIPSTSP